MIDKSESLRSRAACCIDTTSVHRLTSGKRALKAVLATGLLFLSHIPAIADAISPAITGDGKQYSKDLANSAYFGSGISGRLTEASTLRFEGEQETASGNHDVAIKKLRKAVQLDPADPTGHILYARALSAKVRSSQSPDPSLIAQAIEEWKLIWHHDADLLEQVEGRRESRALSKLAKSVSSKKMLAQTNPKRID